MSNTIQPVTKVQNLLKHGEISGHIQQLANAGDLNGIKNFLDMLLADSRFKFDPNEPNFSLQFSTPHSSVTLDYTGTTIGIKEKKRKDIDADLPTRIKKGIVPIEEIESALENGTMTDVEFKDALKNIEPHVSEHYRLLLTHENEVYLRKEGPAIKVELHSGVLYAEDEKEREKKLREEKDAALEKDEKERTAYDIKCILDGIIPTVSLDAKVQQGEMIIQLISYLSMINNPVEMQMLVGTYENAGIEIINVNGTLMVANENDFYDNHRLNKEAHTECQELLEEKQEELDKQITRAVFGNATSAEINALYAKKEELELVVEDAHALGKTEDEIKYEIETSASTATKTVDLEEKSLTSVIPEANLVTPEPEPEIKQVDSIDEQKKNLTDKCVALIASGKVDPNVLIRNARENPAAQKIIKECIENGTINPENYPELNGSEMVNDKSGESLTAKKVMNADGTTKYIPETIDLSKQIGPKIVYDPNE